MAPGGDSAAGGSLGFRAEGLRRQSWDNPEANHLWINYISWYDRSKNLKRSVLSPEHIKIL